MNIYAYISCYFKTRNKKTTENIFCKLCKINNMFMWIEDNSSIEDDFYCYYNLKTRYDAEVVYLLYRDNIIYVDYNDWFCNGFGQIKFRVNEEDFNAENLYNNYAK